MSENEFLIFHKLFCIGIALLHTVSFTLFMKSFLTERKHLYRKLLLAFSLYLVSWLLSSQITAVQSVFTLLFTVLLLAVSKTLKLKNAFTLLLAILYCSVRVSSGLMTESLYYTAKELFPFHSETPERIYLNSAAETLLFGLSHLILLSVMLYVLCRQLKKRQINLHWRELCYLCLIPSAGILFGQMVSRLLFEISDGIPLLLYERHPIFLIAVPLLALLFYTGTLLTIAFWQGTDILRKEREEYFVNLKQIQAIQDRIQETELFYARFRKIQHEIRGHLNTIKGLSQNGQYNELDQYVARMDESMQSLSLILQTGNAVTDVIVNDKKQQCLARNINFHADFHYPAAGQYDSFDLGIILQNLLQNALEACESVPEEDRYISLVSRQKGKFFLIEVKNTFYGEIRFEQNGLPETTKTKDKVLHGIGLSNVRREAEKYMGELELRTENHEFYATVLLQERSNL